MAPIQCNFWLKHLYPDKAIDLVLLLDETLVYFSVAYTAASFAAHFLFFMHLFAFAKTRRQDILR